jgi:hypothetical protein
VKLLRERPEHLRTRQRKEDRFPEEQDKEEDDYMSINLQTVNANITRQGQEEEEQNQEEQNQEEQNQEEQQGQETETGQGHQAARQIHGGQPGSSAPEQKQSKPQGTPHGQRTHYALTNIDKLCCTGNILIF